jgi:Zn-dependent protease with chaperone function
VDRDALDPRGSLRLNTWTLRTLCLLLLTLLAACAAPVTQRTAIDSGAEAVEAGRQKQMAIRSFNDQQKRVWRLARPLLLANADLCGDALTADPGVLTWFGAGIAPDLRPAADALGLGAQAEVLAVAPGSAAERAGIRVGDELLQVNGVALPPDRKAPQIWQQALARAPRSGVYPLQVRRGGQTLRVELDSQTACAYPAYVIDGDAVNAFADGKAMYITRGMMRFAQDDQELSLVLGHELAHNIMSHIDKKKTNAGLGLILDLLAAAGGVNTQGAFSNMAAGAYSQEFEAEADYVGIYLLERAGVDAAGSADFWRRMAAEHPASIRSNHTASHPATSRRFIAIEQTVEEVAAKRRAGQPLKPNMASRRVGD